MTDPAIEPIYKKLATHLDNLPGGFPPTETGVELRILKRLFTPEEAEFALHLTLIAEEPRVIARRANISVKEAAQRLESMAKKGLIYRVVNPPGSPPKYMAAQYVIGIWEFHVNDLNPGLIKDMDEYIPTLMKEAWKIPQLRTVPVNKSISAQMEIMTYENAEEMVRSKKRALVAPCICRREQKMIGKGCDKPENVCLIFGSATDYYQRNQLGRIIDIQEALDILKIADRSGLVLQPTNAKSISNICCCCGCCCGILRKLRQFPAPADMVSTPFIAKLNVDTCKACGVCVKRCQMDAIQQTADTVQLDPTRCIGCGLCVSTCPTGALTLIRKPEQRKIPQTITMSAIDLGRARGKLDIGEILKLQIKSKMDRLLSLYSQS